MKCEEFRDNIASLIDQDECTQQMRAHLSQCEACEKYYQQTIKIIDMATPKKMPVASASVKDNVFKKTIAPKALSFKARSRKLIRFGTWIALPIAALFIIFFSITSGPSEAKAANRIFNNSIASTGLIKSMVMTLNVRTLPHDNFEYIDAEGKMVPHTITVVNGNPGKWRIDKGGRVCLFDGQKQYMWIEGIEGGMVGSKYAGFAEWFKLLLDPQMILANEKAATKDKSSEYSILETDSAIFLTVNAKAKGDFTNSYLLNSSIEESDNRREYVFEKTTNLMKSLKIYIVGASREVLILETTDIKYNVSVDEAALTKLPAGYEWTDVNKAANATGNAFVGISPEEAAAIVFDALSNKKTEGLEAFASFNKAMMFTLNKEYGGLKVIKLGTAFQSGQYGGYFIPYEIVMPNGKIKKHNLALRNDNPNKAWIVDGGL